MNPASLSRRDRTAHMTLLLLGMAYMSSIFSLQGALLSAIIDAFRLTDSGQGLVSTAAFIGGIIALVIAFCLSTRVKKYTLLKIAVALCGVFLIVLEPVGTFPAFIAAWIVIGIGTGFMDTLLSACVSSLYEGSVRERMLNLLHAAYGIASMLTPQLYAMFIQNGMPWRHVYPVVGIAGLILLAAMLFILRNEPAPETGSNTSRGFTGALKPILLPLMLAMLMHGIFLSGLNTWCTRYVFWLAGTETGIPGASFLFAGVLIIRLIAAAFKPNAKLCVLYAGIASAITLLAGVITANPLCMRIALLLCGMSFGTTIPLILSEANNACPGALMTTTILMLSYYIGESIGSPAFGAFEALAGLNAGMFFCGACMLAMSAACFLFYRIRKH